MTRLAMPVSSSMVIKTTPFAGARHLPHENEPSHLEPAPVAGLHDFSAGDHALAVQVATQETDRMVSQRQPHMKPLNERCGNGVAQLFLWS